MDSDEEKISSAKIKRFLDFIEQSRRDYEFSSGLLVQYEKETQDILHFIELNSLKCDAVIDLALKLKTIRQERRKAKNTLQHLQPVIEFLNTNQSRDLIYKLQAILGDVRKAEKHTSTATYNMKTDILTREEEKRYS